MCTLATPSRTAVSASLFLALALLAPRAHSAPPDTTTASRYFPLAVGNEWHYEGWHRDADGALTETFVWRDHVIAFDPAPPGVYVVQRFRRETPAGGTPIETAWTERWRYDPDTRRVEGEEAPRTPCPLDAAFGDSVPCWNSPSFSGYEDVTGGYGEQVAVGDDVVTTSRKEYFAPFGQGGVMGYTETEYAAGVGETRWEQKSIGWKPNATGLRTLAYARVGGEAYGEALFPVASEPPPAPEGLACSVGPNPARGAATLRCTLGAPAPVRLALFDVLGREVASADPGRLGTGPHRLALDLSALPAGVYVWRLSAGSTAEAGRLTVAR